MRRTFEALLDLGSDVSAKGIGHGISEYREIPQRLHEHGVLGEEESQIMKMMAGYRNRMVHFYHEVSIQELYDICTNHLHEIRLCGQAIKKWVKDHPEMTEKSL